MSRESLFVLIRGHKNCGAQVAGHKTENLYFPRNQQNSPEFRWIPLPPCNNKIEMRTERQIEASRANGARSRGPVTPEGKRNSSGNALKHGLLADTIVLKGELEDRFLELLADFDRELQPETTMEHLLVQKMAAAQWRQFRLWGMEKAAMEYQIRNQAGAIGRGESNATRASLAFQALSDNSRSLDLLHRYDSLCDRQYLRAHKRFLELRRGRGDSPAPVPSNPQPEVPTVPEVSGEDAPAAEQTPVDLTNEKQPNEPNNLLKTLAPAAMNLTPEPDAPDPAPSDELRRARPHPNRENQDEAGSAGHDTAGATCLDKVLMRFL
jgi:hypothetical protein